MYIYIYWLLPIPYLPACPIPSKMLFRFKCSDHWNTPYYHGHSLRVGAINESLDHHSHSDRSKFVDTIDHFVQRVLLCVDSVCAIAFAPISGGTTFTTL